MSFTNLPEFGDILLSSLFLLLCAAISVHICFGAGTKNAREALIGSFVALIFAVQLYHLIQAAVYVPATKFFIFKSHLHRNDCINSGKGGKRPGHSISQSIDLNPCFCKYGNNCTVLANGLPYTESCPIHSTSVSCLNKLGNKVHPYISKLRNCRGGQGNECTKNEPCYPCELNRLPEFQADRCRACSTDNLGNCNFIPEKGPYCYDKKGSRKAVPCKTCCTEPIPLIVDGICY
mmetsp:Transcript_17652/g.24241  ORF Transcript_17652/g.24241 Transcript_17652/m.24241 type:complete len:234 (+) Transcript_17652:21-722(+)